MQGGQDTPPDARSRLLTPAQLGAAGLDQVGVGRVMIERLPAYAPELNPVENMWGHLETHARRTQRRLPERFGTGLPASAPNGALPQQPAAHLGVVGGDGIGLRGGQLQDGGRVGHGDDAHAGGPRRGHARHRILDDDARRGREAEDLGGAQEEVGGGLAVRDVLDG